MYSVDITDSAKAELRSIFNYIHDELGQSAGAKRIVDKLEKTIYSLKKFPKFRKYVYNKDYYITNCGKYYILYKVQEKDKKVIVAHIVYSKKRPKTY